MNQKPTLERIVTIGAQAFLIITLLFVVNRSLGVPPIVNRAIALLLLTGMVSAPVQSIRML